MKTNALLALVLAGTLGLSSTAIAQETATTETDTASSETETASEEPAQTEQTTAGGELSLGEEVNEGPKVGQRYARAEFNDWLIQCVKTENGNDPCNMFQLLRDTEGNPVAEVVMQPLSGQGQAIAGANVVTPLETLLTAQLSIAVDAGKAKRYPFSFCTKQGCVSRIGLTANDLASYKRGNEAKVVMVPAGAPDKPVQLTMSLAGFTAAYDSLSK